MPTVLKDITRANLKKGNSSVERTSLASVGSCTFAALRQHHLQQITFVAVLPPRSDPRI